MRFKELTEEDKAFIANWVGGKEVMVINTANNQN